MSEAKVVSFRLESELHRQLAAQAAADDKSVSEFAREVLTEALTSSESLAPSASSIDAVLGEVRSLRSQLSLTLEAMLVATRVLTPDDARLFVEERLPRPQS